MRRPGLPQVPLTVCAYFAAAFAHSAYPLVPHAGAPTARARELAQHSADSRARLHVFYGSVREIAVEDVIAGTRGHQDSLPCVRPCEEAELDPGQPIYRTRPLELVRYQDPET